MCPCKARACCGYTRALCTGEAPRTHGHCAPRNTTGVPWLTEKEAQQVEVDWVAGEAGHERGSDAPAHHEEA